MLVFTQLNLSPLLPKKTLINIKGLTEAKVDKILEAA
jgi:hypothetical protein